MKQYLENLEKIMTSVTKIPNLGRPTMEEKKTNKKRCDYCNKVIAGLPYTCPLCEGTFCVNHHLPESHNCERKDEAKPPSVKTSPGTSTPSSSTVTREEDQSTWFFPLEEGEWSWKRRRNKFNFSRKEMLHLTGAAVLTALVALSFNWGILTHPFQAFLLSSVMVVSFLLHEIAHKFTAQHFGIWAEFRLILFGVLLTVFSILPFSPAKILAPGAVMIGSPTNKEEGGKISVSGPLVNLILGLIFSFVALFLSFLPDSISVFYIGIFLNGFIALFNLLPIAMLDGKDVLRWDKLIWGGAFGSAIFLTVLGFFLYYSFP